VPSLVCSLPSLPPPHSFPTRRSSDLSTTVSHPYNARLSLPCGPATSVTAANTGFTGCRRRTREYSQHDAIALERDTSLSLKQFRVPRKESGASKATRLAESKTCLTKGHEATPPPNHAYQRKAARYRVRSGKASPHC